MILFYLKFAIYVTVVKIQYNFSEVMHCKFKARYTVYYMRAELKVYLRHMPLIDKNRGS